MIKTIQFVLLNLFRNKYSDGQRYIHGTNNDNDLENKLKYYENEM
jgi:hypothetical protein